MSSKIAQELVSPATRDNEAVPIPAVLQQSNRGQQNVTLYVRPTAFRVWKMLDQLSAEDRRQARWRRTRCPMRSPRWRSSEGRPVRHQIMGRGDDAPLLALRSVCERSSAVWVKRCP